MYATNVRKRLSLRQIRGEFLSFYVFEFFSFKYISSSKTQKPKNSKLKNSKTQKHENSINRLR